MSDSPYITYFRKCIEEEVQRSKRMIKLELANEQKPEPEYSIEFEFRRHSGAGFNPDYTNRLYLVSRRQFDGKDVYPIKIDGDTKEFHIRRVQIEKLGFKLIYD